MRAAYPATFIEPLSPPLVGRASFSRGQLTNAELAKRSPDSAGSAGAFLFDSLASQLMRYAGHLTLVLDDSL